MAFFLALPAVPPALAALGKAAAVVGSAIVAAVVVDEGIDAVSEAMSAAEEGAQERDQTGATTTVCQDCDQEDPEHWHHEYPQQFRGQFARAGIDIDAPQNGRVIPAREHLRMHGQGYNADWAGFFAQRPNATASEIAGFKGVMTVRYGLAAYRRPSGRYPIK